MIDSSVYANRRSAVIDKIDEPLVVLAGHAEMQRTNDMAYAFEQEAHFLWLTGISAPNWLLIIEQDRVVLVTPEVDAVHEIFDGSLSADEAQRISGVDEVISLTEYHERLDELAGTHAKAATLGADPSAKWYSFSLNPAPEVLRTQLGELFAEVGDCRAAISALRAIKESSEIKSTKAAVATTTRAFENTRKLLTDARHEYELEALLSSEFRRTGAGGHAYDPIVAGGKNACTLHYGDNNDELPENGLVLIDAGARVDGYAADITRTYAIGTPSDRQIAVHKAVQDAHVKIIALIQPGVKLADYQQAVDDIMKDALQGLGLLADRSDVKTYRKYFPHAIGHGLGLDVHESLGGYDSFVPGMVLTVEPGVYIPEEGIGVRIEDDILVTQDGHSNLSGELPISL